MPHLLLQLENAVHEGLGRGRAAGHVDIHRHDTVAAASDRVAVVVVAAAVGAATHRDDPAGVGHLIVDLAQGGGHLVGKGAGDNHHVGLTGRGTENDAETILIVAGGRQVHHLDGAACETEGHGPQGALARPIGDLIERGAGQVSLMLRVAMAVLRKCHAQSHGAGSDIQRILNGALLALLAGEGNLAAGGLHRGRRSGSALNKAGRRVGGLGGLGGGGGQEGGGARAVGEQSRGGFGCGCCELGLRCGCSE